MKYICQKHFNIKGDYSQEDINSFNITIKDGINELKHNWKNTKGIYFTEDKDKLQIELKINELNYIRLNK